MLRIFNFAGERNFTRGRRFIRNCTTSRKGKNDGQIQISSFAAKEI